MGVEPPAAVDCSCVTLDAKQSACQKKKDYTYKCLGVFVGSDVRSCSVPEGESQATVVDHCRGLSCRLPALAAHNGHTLEGRS